MEAPTFGGKPSDAHVIWRGSGGNVKRFDEGLLRRWCSKYGVDYESSKRVDHDRGSDPRQQHRIVFAWDDSASESFAVGDDEWEIQTQKTPRTFVEIDSEGEARIRGWNSERVLDVHELRVDGASLVLEAAELPGKKRLAVETLARPPD